MTTFHITGKPTKVSKEEVRTILHATKTVLEFHNLTPAMKNIRVYFKPTGHKELKTPTGVCYGNTLYSDSKIWLEDSMQFNQMFTTIIHEMVHVYHPRCGLDEHSEHQTSTLTARLKPTIAKIYTELSNGIYKRAGYIAHVKMSYIPKKRDTYNTSEDFPVPIRNHAKKYRCKRT